MSFPIVKRRIRGTEILYLIMLGIIILAMGGWIPYVTVNAMLSKQISEIVGIIIILITVGAAFLISAVSVGLYSEIKESEDYTTEVREWITIYRARQRALLEELDEIVQLLREIRDVLKSVGEE